MTNSGRADIRTAAMIALSGIISVPETELTFRIICFNFNGSVYFPSSVMRVAGSIIEFHLATNSRKKTVASPGSAMGI